jgi:4-diphosphocytidyl-2-C-methyl-D-erythritol kinase
MTRFSAPAKLNLGLRILRKRQDGYHDILSLFQTVTFADTITGEEDTVSRIAVDNAELSGVDNLVLRADIAFRRRYGIPGGVRYHLEKNIPLGGGFGGGSSHAAAVLRHLAAHYHSPVTDPALAACAVELGSDVPFFLRGGTAVVRGRGEIVEPVAWPMTFTYVIIHPRVNVSTAWAYSVCSPRKAGKSDSYARMIEHLAAGTIEREEFLGVLVNDFEPVVFETYPAVREARDRFRDTGALAVLMTGSGSGLFGIFATAAGAEEAARAFGDTGYVVVTATATPPFLP